MSADNFDFKSTAATSAGERQPPVPDDRLRAQASQRMSAEVGEIMAILVRSDSYRRMTLGEVDSLVRPALMTRQFCMIRGKSDGADQASSTALGMWAMVSDEVDQRLAASPHEPIRLAPAEWRSGPHAWLVDAVGAPDAIRHLMQHLGAVVLKSHTVKLRQRNSDGVWTVSSLPKAN
jgi:hemolysin-activating ACP:hemolysin acyltransferase